jgi:SAM-dependent methyltransferase
MKLFGWVINTMGRSSSLFKVYPPVKPEGGVQLRSTDGQGPYTKYFANYIPRKVEATFYEFLREALPVMDAAINRLVSLDGHIVVKGNNEALVEEIQEWFYNVRVNDIQRGIQAFHQNLTNEAFEQGFALGEFITDRKRTDIVELRVGDSKCIKFARNAAGPPEQPGLTIYQRADNDLDWRPLDQTNLIYFSINNENQNPHGVPLFRSCEFTAKILATMHNSLLNVWERFGDPAYSVVYKTSKRDGTDLVARRTTIATEFDQAVRAKREGKSADFIRAIDTNSSIEVKIIGADGQVLELEVPARHVLEQIIAKTGLPAWMLGMHWSTTESLSDNEAEILLADVATRQAAKMPHFYNLIRALLLLRGRTWKKGDWWLEWAQVNLKDVVKQAQARFLHAQADMYYLQNAAAAGIQIDRSDLAIGKKVAGPWGARETKLPLPGQDFHGMHGGHEGCKEVTRPTPWPELDRIETQYEAKLKTDWAALQDRVMTTLKLPGAKTASAPPDITKDALPSMGAFTFTDEQRAAVMKAMRDMIGAYVIDDPDSPVRWYYGQSYSLGLIQAAKLIGKERPILDIIKNAEVYDALCASGFDFVKDNATKAIVNRILPEMQAQMLAGTNPVHVAARLRKLFEDKNSDWERLARTEMTMAAERAKLDEWKQWKVEMVEFVPAPDGCPICFALAGVYPIGSCPVPGRDTHPRCRCGTRPAAGKTFNVPGSTFNVGGRKTDMTRQDWIEAWRRDPHWAGSMEPSPLAKSLVAGEKENTGTRSILEIGCGNGRDSIFFGQAGYSVTGIDISPDAVEIAQKANTLKNVTFEVGDAEGLRFANGQFDAVYSLSVLHSTDMNKSIREVSRVLAASGIALLYLYVKSVYHNEETEAPARTEINFKIGEAEKLFKESGFKIADKYRFEAEDRDENGTHVHSVVVYTLRKQG